MLAKIAERQSDRAESTMRAIADDVRDGEFDGARSHIAILRRQLDELDEKCLDAAKAS